MDKKTVKKIQKIQLEMLLEVRQICERHDISYFLCCGTLLGAVRHKGPVPWDDDLDVGMLRDEYERFLSFAEKELSARYFLQTWHTDLKYALPHCKIRDLKSHYIEETSRRSGCRDGISIDVLPFDAVPNTRFMQALHGLFLFDIMNVLKIKRGWKFIKENRVGFVRRAVYQTAALFCTETDLIKLHEKICRFYNRQSGYIYVSEAAGLDFFRFVNKRSNYLRTGRLKYMDECFCVPVNYKSILRHSYGNYMQLPPKKDRKGQPGVIKVEFGEKL